MGMHALSSSMSTNTPASPRSPTTLVAKRTSGSVTDARGRRYSVIEPSEGSDYPPANAPALRLVRVWVDLTNSPHVLVLRPIVEALRAQGADVEVTARDFAQTVGLAERFGLRGEVLRRPRGGGVAAKAVGLASRATALVGWARRSRRTHGPFDLALGHGSNDITVAAAALRIPRSTVFVHAVGAVQ